MANWASVANLGDPSTPEWQQANLQEIEPIKGQRWNVYKPAASAFEGFLNDLIKLGYNPISSGGYNYRNIRGGNQLSQHAFGTAIDLNSLTNPRGQSATDIPQAAELAKKWGLEWGGNWQSNPDPMHFEYTGEQGGGRAAGGTGGDLTPQQQWMSGLWQYAQAVSAKTGIDPRVVMSQAALETGYGKSAPNYNYFGIKGQGAGQKTLEYVNGKMTPVEADFRAYKNPEESFSDYGNVLMGQRYADVRGAKGLEAQIAALGKSGYATDPNYSAKLLQIAQGIPEGGYGTAASAGHPPNPTVGTTGAAAAATPPVARPSDDKWAKAIGGGIGALADMEAPRLGATGNAPQLPAQAPQAGSPMPFVADSQIDQNRRNQLAQLMQQYWI